ncbi:ZIP family metal transporter [Bacteroidales bacterium OttesenSCG-928-B11]|nr:ZIP family metal transporter [Bacteroidales bacterium OttesenSCG-928-C03]MDL2312313.1 ZIP family metal transporter [Bacteroidales bacterium OttesenSCG-928-B11]MDL2326448.1 ZIP family metal transporter [Bacteroidales bacterium OttesenSCG-928-A14]
MADWIVSHHIILAALLAGLFTWATTAFGASFVFFFKNISPKIYTIMLGFAAGIMIAASFWSLLLPSIEMVDARGGVAWLPAAVGFICGGIFLRLIDMLIPHLHLGAPDESKEGPKTKLKRAWLMIFAVTIHNIPEGLAVGVAIGALASGGDVVNVTAAISLVIGIGLQNIPEGFAVSAPLRGEGFSRGKSFFYGQLSGSVELLGAVIGALIASSMTTILPYALSFAAGAMIYVVIEELIPESQQSKHADLATISTMIGFAIMMILDVSLG